VGKRRKRKRDKRRLAPQQELPDRRATFAGVEAVGGVPVTESTFVIVVEPIRLETGDVLMFQSPHVPPFYLLTAKALRDRAEPRRIRALAKTATTPDGTLRPANPADSFAALEGLAQSVILSAAAIEAHANDMIRRLPSDATVEVERRGLAVLYEQDSMERGLNLAEKLDLVGPMLTGRASIKGTRAWEAYRRVVPLRNELLHKTSEAENDPDDPSPFGQLMLGRGSGAPEDAAAVIHAVEPDWIPRHVRSELGIN
jgi:hypothetical protein